MNFRPLACALGFTLAALPLDACVLAQDASVKTIVDTIANQAVSGGRCFGLAIGVNQAGAISEQFYGGSGTSRPLDGRTEFEIESVTKTFTALVLALAAERPDHRLGLDQTLQDFAPKGIRIPDFQGTQIHLVDLATHTSGLPRKAIGLANQGPLAIWRYTSSQTLRSVPGGAYLYSNLGFGLLGLVEERAEQKSLERIFEEDITSPLGMSDTRINLSPEQLARKAQGHHPNGRNAPRDDPSVKRGVVGAFALNSTLDDMMRYLAFQMGGGSGALMRAALLTQTPVHSTGPRGKVGLAWNTNALNDGTAVIAKDGAGPGFTAFVAFTPATHNGVVVLANQLSCRAPRISQAILTALNHAAASEGELPADDPLEGETQ